jgi:translocation and assembly module TamB
MARPYLKAERRRPEPERRGGPARRAARTRRRWPRVLGWIVAALVLLPVLLVALILGALQTGPGQRFAQDTAEDLVSGLQIGALEGAPPFSLTLRDVSLSDAQGAWLTLDRTRLDWSPLSVLGGTAEVETLALGRLEIARAPVAPPEAEPEAAPDETEEPGLALPELPVGLRVRDFSVERLVLGEPLLGERLELAIDGRLAAAEAGRVETALTVERTDGEGRIEASAVYLPDAERLEAEVVASAPAGGLASRLSGLPGEPPLSVALSGSGPLQGWEGQWSVGAGAVLQAGGAIAVTGLEPPTVRLTGTAEVAELLPPDLRPLARPNVAFALAGSYGEEIHLEIEEIETQAALLTGRAALDPAAETVAVDLDLLLDDPAPLENLSGPVQLSGGRVQLRAEGPLGAPEATLSAEVAGPRVAGFGAERVLLQARAREAALPAQVVADLDVVGLNGPDDVVRAIGQEVSLFARGTASAEAVVIDRLSLQAPALTANGEGTVEFAELRGDLSLRLAYPELSRLEPLAGLALGGGLTSEIYAQLQSSGAISTMATGETSAFAAGIPALDALLGATPGFWLDGRLTETGDMVVQALGVDGAAASLQAEAQLAGEGASARLDAQVSDLSALQQAGIPAAGQASVTASLDGTLSAPAVQARLTSPRLEISGTPLEEVVLTADAEGLPPDLAGRVRLAAGTPAGRVELASEVAVGQERVRLADLALRRGGDALDGEISMPLSGPPAEGRLRLQVADAGAYGGIVPALRSGSLTATLDLSARDGSQAAAVDAQTDGLVLAGGTRLGRAQIEARLGDLLGTPSMDASARIADLEAAGVAVESAAATAQGSLSALAVDLQAQGQTTEGDGRPLALDLSGELGLAEATELRLAELRATYGELEARLRGPARLVYGSDRLLVEDLKLALNEGELDATVELAGDRVEADLALRALPLELAEAAGVDVPVVGTLNASAQVSGSLPRPRGQFSIGTENLRLAERVSEEAPPLDLTVEGSLDGGRLQASAALSGFAEQDLRADAELPLLIRNDPPGVELPEDEPISLAADWSGQLAPIVGLLPIDVVRIEGEGKIDLSVAGTLANPQAEGTLSIAEGAYENYTLGTLLRPFSLRLEGEGSRIVLREFNAEDVGGGGMSVSGWVDLAGTVPSFEFSAQASNLDVVRRDDLRATVDADLALDGNLEDALLSGSVELEDAEVFLTGDVPATIPTLDVTQVNTGRPDEEAQAAAAEEGPGGGLGFLAFDVELRIPGQLFIRGRGLDSEWKGQFELAGTAAQPRLQGSLEPVRGFFDLAGNRFELEKGQIRFTGGTDFNPQLDLSTVYEEDGFTARIRVTGPASSPEIELTSSPELPRDEILARILFGQSTARLTASQAIAVARAAASLASGGGGITDYARQTLGVDVLTFLPGDTEGDLGQVEAGKYLGDDVFVGVRQGASPGSTSAVVEWEITPNLSLESEVGAGTGESNLGLNWSWDY